MIGGADQKRTKTAWVLHAVLFYVEILEATPLSVFVGLVAMISSAIVFTASAMWWLRKSAAQSYFKVGVAGFVVKNIFDIVNTTLIFGQVHATPTIYNIKMLAVELGGQLTQMAFWIFVFFFFGYVISHYAGSQQQDGTY